MTIQIEVKSRGKRRIAVTFRMLEVLLNYAATGRRTEVTDGWPDDIEIHRVLTDFESDSIEIFASSETFEAGEPGSVIPYWTPKFRVVEEENS